MSWIAYYVEISAQQQQEEFGRRAARHRPADTRPRRRRRSPRRWVSARAAGAGRMLRAGRLASSR